jgi:hypothetical protein
MFQIGFLKRITWKSVNRRLRKRYRGVTTIDRLTSANLTLVVSSFIAALRKALVAPLKGLTPSRLVQLTLRLQLRPAFLRLH